MLPGNDAALRSHIATVPDDVWPSEVSRPSMLPPSETIVYLDVATTLAPGRRLRTSSRGE